MTLGSDSHGVDKALFEQNALGEIKFRPSPGSGSGEHDEAAFLSSTVVEVYAEVAASQRWARRPHVDGADVLSENLWCS